MGAKGDPVEIERRPIMITVGADHSQVAIRVHDVAGGIPFRVADRVWSYMYSTSPDSKSGSDFSQQGTPLAGYGVGLPLSRLYARYLGGSLHLQSFAWHRHTQLFVSEAAGQRGTRDAWA